MNGLGCKFLLLALLLLAVGTSKDPHEDVPVAPTAPQTHYHGPGDKEFWINTLICVFLCCLAGFCSGNTVGLLSIDPLELEIRKQNGSLEEKAEVDMILDVLHNHHLLLVTLLLYNAIAMETLPLVIHTIVPAWLAIILSTCVVLIIGEIVPQALCTGPNKLAIAKRSVPIIRFMIKIFWCISYPLGKALDWILGEHSNHRLERKDLAALLKTQDESTLKSSEIMLLGAILKLRERKVHSILIPLKDVYMIDLSSRVDRTKIQELRQREYSFVPVYKQRRSNIVAILKTKEFVVVAANRLNYGKPFSDFIHEDDSLLTIYEDTNLMELLMLFEAKKARIALVANKKRKVEAGVNSIYYSKSDMILQRSDLNFQVIGVVALNNVFQQLSGLVEQTQTEQLRQSKPNVQDTEMSTLKTRLLENSRP